MTLALRFCFFLALGASAVSLLSMATIELFDYFSPSGGSRWDLISEMGDWVVCIFYIGGSMGTLAWLKIWVGNPSFNSGTSRPTAVEARNPTEKPGCSMAAMILYTVVIKEGALPKLREIVLIVLLGCPSNPLRTSWPLLMVRLYRCSRLCPHLPLVRYDSTPGIDLKIPGFILDIAQSVDVDIPAGADGRQGEQDEP